MFYRKKKKTKKQKQAKQYKFSFKVHNINSILYFYKINKFMEKISTYFGI